MTIDQKLSWEETRNTWADTYLLICLARMDSEAEANLARTMHAPSPRTPDAWRNTFEGEFAITADLPDFVRSLWEEQKRVDATLSPRSFAARNREEIFIDVLYS